MKKRVVLGVTLACVSLGSMFSYFDAHALENSVKVTWFSHELC